jgi:hypothetical protein
VRRERIERACGNPIRFPVSDECLQAAGRQSPVLKAENDLMMNIWRACSMTPASAESIRQELAVKGGDRTPMGEKIILEMERSETSPDSPCVQADKRDPKCTNGDAGACKSARDNDRACRAWLEDNDTTHRLECLRHAEDTAACAPSAPSESTERDAPEVMPFVPDERMNECIRAREECLHSVDDCAKAKYALQLYQWRLRQSGTQQAPAGASPNDEAPSPPASTSDQGASTWEDDGIAVPAYLYSTETTDTPRQSSIDSSPTEPQHNAEPGAIENEGDGVTPPARGSTEMIETTSPSSIDSTTATPQTSPPNVSEGGGVTTPARLSAEPADPTFQLLIDEPADQTTVTDEPAAAP